MAPSILFVLPSRGGGGGAHSIVQEAAGLKRLGVEVQIAVDLKNQDAFRRTYWDVPEVSRSIRTYVDETSFVQAAAGFEIVCGTTNDTMSLLRAAKDDHGLNAALAYYVQDYEPLFYEVGSPQWQRATESYALIEDCRLFAKTRWLCDIVKAMHGKTVEKVSPSLDHDVYFPDTSRQSGEIRIAAMVRPASARRAPRRTLRIATQLAALYKGRVAVEIFGAPDAELERHHLFVPPGVVNRGRLLRREVAELLRQSDLFLDLSDYQAFGRTGLEAMASACVPVLPKIGGGDEYAIPGVNSFVVDTGDEKSIHEAVAGYLALTRREQNRLKTNCLRTASEFSIHKAAISEFAFFSKIAAEFSATRP